MKKNTVQLLILFLFATQFAFGQVTLYGLKNPTGTANTAFDMVSIDPFTGGTTPLFSTGSLVAVASGATAYDQKNKRYICWGFDVSNNQRLFVADIDSGVVVSHPIISGQPIEMEYDLSKQKNYGLWYDFNQGMEYFVSVDLTTGVLTNIKALPAVSGVAIGASTFDSNLGRYIFIGIENNELRLITLDSGTGNILYSVPINQNGLDIGGLEYDLTANKLFGLHNRIDSSSYDPILGTYLYSTYFSEVDVMTGAINIVNTTPINYGSYIGYAVGGIAFDQKTQSYIGVLATDLGFSLKIINATTGLVISDVNLGNNGADFFEIQCDNYSFAKSFYVNTDSGTLEKTVDGIVYPNPVKDWLQIETDAEIETVTIYNFNGQAVFSLNNIADRGGVDVSSLANGAYILEAKTSVGVLRKRFLK
jgi:hypothetical protein